MPKKKLAIGWFTFTCSEDNTILFVELLNQNYFTWKEVLEFRHCKVLKTDNSHAKFDVAFVEGAISTKKEEDTLRELRKSSKRLVAVGACACTGLPAGQRNSFTPETLKVIKPFLDAHALRDKIVPLSEIVKVDDSLPGCPMVPAQFVSLLERYLVEFGVK
jgi:coenzyme F420-reducing hydrogenase gamma subunit